MLVFTFWFVLILDYEQIDFAMNKCGIDLPSPEDESWEGTDPDYEPEEEEGMNYPSPRGLGKEGFGYCSFLIFFVPP